MEKTISLDNFEREVITRPMRPSMPDISFENKLEHTPADFSALYGRKFIQELLKKDFIQPDKNGFVEYRCVFNARRNSAIRGVSQLILKARQHELNSPTAAFVSQEAIEKAMKDGLDIAVRKNERPVLIPVENPENKTQIAVNKWFNAIQIVNYKSLENYFRERMSRDEDEHQRFLDRQHFGASVFKRAKLNSDTRRFTEERILSDKDISPETFMAQLMAAGEMGIRLFVDPRLLNKLKSQMVSRISIPNNASQNEKFVFFKFGKKIENFRNIYISKLREEKSRKSHKNRYGESRGY